MKTKILHHALIYVKFSISDAMSFEIISKLVMVFRNTSYFCIFWQVDGVSNMKILQNYFKPVLSHIVTESFVQHIWLLLLIISPTWKPVVFAQDEYTNSTFYFSQQETEIAVATSLSITFSLLPYSLEIISKQHFRHFQ